MAADDKTKKKKKKGVTAEVGGVKIKVKARKAAKPRTEKRAAKKSDGNAFETLSKLAEHPMVADLIAVGATAAVAALAERGLSKNRAEGNAVKNAGKAAAAAIGKRLMDEFKAVKDAAKDAEKKA